MSSSSSDRHDTANWIYVKNLWGGGDGQKKQSFMLILEKLRMFFPNINSHILGLIVMSVEGTSKHQKILTKHTHIHL